MILPHLIPLPNLSTTQLTESHILLCSDIGKKELSAHAPREIMTFYWEKRKPQQRERA
jgi:hypothetical protein